MIAFVGGAAVVAGDRSGKLETALTLSHPGYRLRFRSVAWEGDTVFSQPRELNFPRSTRVLREVGATVVCVQFGALEALDPQGRADSFVAAYRTILDEIMALTPRVVVVVPPPFEIQPPPLPELGHANGSLSSIANALRALANERRLPVIDLFRALTDRPPSGRWTLDGRQLNEAGIRAVAEAWVVALGSSEMAERVGRSSFWREAAIAELLEAVSHKNRLWFDSWRPMNWAFLAGDRTEQQASRDHRDRSIRWFPAEMQEYGPLLVEAEIRIESRATAIQAARER